MKRVWVERRKWPDAPHYRHRGWILGEDEFGVWIELRVGTPVHRGDEVLFHGQWQGLMCAPREHGWLAWFMDGSDLDLYVDIGTPPVTADGAVTMIDLDLDVVRWRSDGRVELVDEDEFDRHRIELAYPDHLVEMARASAREVVDAATAGVEPFGGRTAETWWKRVGRGEPGPIGSTG